MLSLKKITQLSVVPVLLILIATGCSDNSTGTDQLDYDASAMLDNEANNIILKTYIDLDTEAAALVEAVNELEQNTTEANLEAAQQQWRNTRQPWESSESFLFGPVASEGIDPAIDDWPVNKTDLDNVLASNDELTKEYVDGLETGLKGFHTIEYLLFGDGNNKTVNDFTAREFDYLTSAAASLKGETATLATAWNPQGENYASAIADAGNGSNIYLSQKAALEELINGMEIIADEVANGKIADPLSQQDPTLVESQFSFNSKVDFQNNMRSIQHIYTGAYKNNSGPGISDFVTQLDTDLDNRFKTEINNAITAIDAIPGNFRDAITDNPEDVEEAQQAVRTILATIQEDIKPLLNEF
jgi:predicted lipoprotein